MSRKKKARRREVVLQREVREPVAPALTQRWVSWLVPVLIGLVTFAAFLPTLQNQLVHWDDHQNLLDNPRYRGLGWAQLRWMWTTSHMNHWIPLTWMTFGLDYLLWGMNPLGYHLTNLLLHAANAVVFYFVALGILSLARPGPVERGQAGLTVSAAFAALLFALHPLRVESVAWATERRDVLSGLSAIAFMAQLQDHNMQPLGQLRLRLELLPLEDGCAREPFTPLYAAGQAEPVGDSLHP